MQDKRYAGAINVIAHLVLTKPNVVRKFLANNGVRVSREAGEKQLVNEIIDLIETKDPNVLEDLTSLFASHITFKGKELLALGDKTSTPEEDEFLGAALGAAAGLVKGIGSWIGAKKRRKAAEAAHKRNIAAQMAQSKANQAKAEAMARMEAMRIKQEQQAAERRRQAEKAERERKEKREKEEAKVRKQKQTEMYMAMGGGLILVIGLVVFVSMKKKAPAPYPPPAAYPTAR